MNAFYSEMGERPKKDMSGKMHYFNKTRYSKAL